MNGKLAKSTGSKIWFSLALGFVFALVSGGGASLSQAAVDQLTPQGFVHLHGQIRDTGGNRRQGYVIISTFNGPELASGPTTAGGAYAFDVPASDHYVVTAMPVQRVWVGSGEAPVGFVDRWDRIDRTTEADLTQDITVTFVITRWEICQSAKKIVV